MHVVNACIGSNQPPPSGKISYATLHNTTSVTDLTHTAVIISPVEHLYWLYFLFSAEDTLSIFSSLVSDVFFGERKRPE